MIGRRFALFALLVVSSHAFGKTGYAHGEDHCYYFDAPAGWTMDNKAMARKEVSMVFYPQGTDWESAPVAMYTQPVSSTPDRSAAVRIKKQVEQVIQMYRSASQTIDAQRLQVIQSKSGTAGELWKFTGYENRGTEFAAYFPAPHTVDFFVMQVSAGVDDDAQLPVLQELAASYRQSTDCKPCSDGDSCTLPQ